MNIKEGIEKRFSVRAFTKEVPDMKLISEILKTANAAPSGGNIQPWKVYVLNEQAKNNLAKETLQNFDTGVQEEIEYDIYPKPLADEYKKRRYECGADMYNALSIENSMSCRKTQKESTSSLTSEKSIMGKLCFTNVIIFLYSA